jgi:hypothetical protein
VKKEVLIKSNVWSSSPLFGILEIRGFRASPGTDGVMTQLIRRGRRDEKI